MSEERWLGCLTVALKENQIECMPGSHRAILSYRRIVRLVGTIPTPRIVAAPINSLKRDAIEAQMRTERPPAKK